VGCNNIRSFWYKSSSGQLRHTSLAKDDMGLDVYLCASGPSLANVKDSDLHISGACVVGVNNAYPHIRPDIWVGVDDPSCYHHQIFSEPFMKLMRGGYQNRTYWGKNVGHQFNTFYMDCKYWPKDKTEEIFTNKNERIIFRWNKNVIGITLHMLLYMGAKRIYLLGSDLDNSKKQYYNDMAHKEPDKIDYNQRCYNEILEFYKYVYETGKKYGVELISCTPNSRLNDFMHFIPYKLALEETKKRRQYEQQELVWGPEVEAKMREKNMNPQSSLFTKEPVLSELQHRQI